MALEALSQHVARFKVGQPSPYDIFDDAGRLLLARGQLIRDGAQWGALLERNALVDPREFDDAPQAVALARPEQLSGLWADSMDALGLVLRSHGHDTNFVQSLDNAVEPLLALIERDPDLAILQVVGVQGSGDASQYASRHAVHTATAACLAAQRLGWAEDQAKCALRVALTMNLAMADLQNELVTQLTPVTASQRASIHTHPERSAQMLQQRGVTDTQWLEAVRQHHELIDGKGYPRGLREVTEVAALVQRCDNFTAKLSARLARPALMADRAVRLQYQSSQGDPMTAALIKEFGLYPPGCVVRLKSGEVGMVVRRGPVAHAPVVAVLMDRSGEPLLAPVRRETADPAFAITALMPASVLRVRVGIDKLVTCAPQ